MKKVLSAIELIVLGSISGLVSLYVGAFSFSSETYSSEFLWTSYFENGWIVFMNLLMPVLLIFLFWFIFSRKWLAYFTCSLICIGGSIINYYKISLRNNPLKLTDIKVFRTAAEVAGKYTYEFNDVIKIACVGIAGVTILCFVLETLLRKKLRINLKWFTRLIGILLVAALMYISVEQLYYNPLMHTLTITDPEIGDWMDTESYVSRGFVYPFIKSGHHMNDCKPSDYDADAAKKLLSDNKDSAIPDDKKVNIIGIMLEAFTDFSDFKSLAEIDAVSEIYEPLHNLEKEAISGNIIANVFAGNTEQTEFSALSGYSFFDEFRSSTNSFVWYLRNQGYETHYAHPDYDWMYHRNDVMNYLGFTKGFFTNNYFGQYVSADYAPFESDEIMVDFVLKDLENTKEALFLFATTYQNHGPYRTYLEGDEIIKEEDGFSEETRNILNNYLTRQKDTIDQLMRLKEGLNTSDKPVVLFFFGDHKAWAGNKNSTYNEIGANFDCSTIDGLEQHFSTPLVIWANDKAKEILGTKFSGNLGDISPCFVINEVFKACEYEGSTFSKLSDEIKEIIPVIHKNGVFLENGKLTEIISAENSQKYNDYLNAQYYYQTHFKY